MHKIILVDDEPEALELLSNVFKWEDMGFSLAGTFGDGKEAWDFVEKTQPNAILTDIKMPYMDGLELAKRISEKYPEIQVVIISAYKDFEYAKLAMKYGVKEFIVKPITFDELKNCIIKLKKDAENSDKTFENYESEAEKTILLAISYINKHLNKNISLQEISDYVGLNKNYFCSYFKKHTGYSFVNFVAKLRIEHAKNLLKSEDIKISAICEIVGYKNQTYFYNLFKSSEGVTPLQYRTDYLSQKMGHEKRNGKI